MQTLEYSMKLIKLLSSVAKLTVQTSQRSYEHIIFGNLSLNLCNKYTSVTFTAKSLSSERLVTRESISNVYEGLLKNANIWKKPVNKTEVTACRENFDKYIELIGKLKENSLPPEIGFSFEPEHYEKIVLYKDLIFELSVLLQCSPQEAFWAILKHRFILQSRLRTLKAKVDLLTGHGFSLEELRKDLWVLTYNLTKLESRINRLKALRLPLKPWMLRCREDVLNKCNKKRERNRLALIPYSSNSEYLCSRLNLDHNQLLIFTSKHPAALKVNVHKVKEILDYLLSEGFTPAQIYVTPRILSHRVSTIKYRLDLLRAKHHPPTSLSLLCKSSRSFEMYIEDLEK